MLFAFPGRAELDQPLFQRGNGALDLRCIALQQVAFAFQTPQCRSRFGLGLAGRFAAGCQDLRLGPGLGCRAGGVLGGVPLLLEIRFSGLDSAGRFAPAIEPDRGFQGTDGRGQFAIAGGLAGLALQGTVADGDVVDDVLEAVEIALCAFQAQFRLVPARAQAGHARGFLKNAAAVLRLGSDEFGNLPLAYQRRRVGSGAGIHEEELHILGPDFLAIDLVGRAGPAGDAAGDFQCVGVIEAGRGELLLIGDGQHDFSMVAGGAPVRAGKDDIFHAIAAQRLGRGCAHHPAQGFKQVGFAATVGSDHASKARVDPQIRGINE